MLAVFPTPFIVLIAAPVAFIVKASKTATGIPLSCPFCLASAINFSSEKAFNKSVGSDKSYLLVPSSLVFSLIVSKTVDPNSDI